MPPIFGTDASLVFIGIRGAGKSTLASIAAKALKWRLVDEKLHFQRVTGFSVSDYIHKYGIEAYCVQEVKVLRSVLSESTRCVIVCSSSCIETAPGRVLLQEHNPLLPIVHVVRDENALEKFLSGRWSGDISLLRQKQEPVYRSCSNLTFFNMSDTDSALEMKIQRFGFLQPTLSDAAVSTYSFLSLKNLESDLLRFLDHIYGRSSEEATLQKATNYPFTFGEGLVPFSYLLPLRFANLNHANPSLEELECGVDFLQYRVDCLNCPHKAVDGGLPGWEYVCSQYGILRRMTTVEVIYYVHLGSESNFQSTLESEDAYFDLLHVGLRLGAEYVMVDMTKNDQKIRTLTSEKGYSKVIGYVHDHSPGSSGGWEGGDRIEWCSRAHSLGCDVVQLTQPATSSPDNMAAQCFSRRMSLKFGNSLMISAFNTGRLGRNSQCFNAMFTPVHHPAIPLQEKNEAVERISVQQAQAALFQSFTYEGLRFYTFGANVLYSLAPELYSAAFASYGMPHKYSKAPASSLDELETLARDDSFGGCGLSLPFKTSVISNLHSMSLNARLIGAVNTILPIRHWAARSDQTESPHGFVLREQHNRGGTVLALYGENTDWVGIRKCALRHLSPANAITPRTTALVVGAGGMARAAVYAMMKAGVRHIVIYNRTYGHAVALIDHFRSQLVHEQTSSVSSQHKIDVDASERNGSATFIALKSLEEPWPSDYSNATIIINCLPAPSDSIGTPSASEEDIEFPVSDAWMASRTGGVYLELAYNMPLPSPGLGRIFSKADQGWIGVSGFEIFLEVAIAQFEFWTGRKAPRYIMKKALIQAVSHLT
jgi:shikimate 5-dehydrogenase/shikimate kinase